MSHYSDDPAMVRVDFFKPSGKWYTTEAVKWTGAYRMEDEGGELLHDAFKHSLIDHFENTPRRLSEMDAICLEPYHQLSHPIMIKAGGWNDN